MPQDAILEQVTQAPLRYFGNVVVKTLVRIHCGCGFHTEVLGDAAKHAREFGHTLHITGEVRAQK